MRGPCVCVGRAPIVGLVSPNLGNLLSHLDPGLASQGYVDSIRSVRPSLIHPYLSMVAGVGSLVMLSITEANPNTPDPVCTVILA